MPDLPFARLRPSHPGVDSVATTPQPPAVPYAELRCATNFSFGYGASHPDELVGRAWELGYRHLAITDVDSLAGIVRAYVHERGIRKKLAEAASDDATVDAPDDDALPPPRLLYGAELHLSDFPAPVICWATDRASYGRLCRIISAGRLRTKKGQCELRWDDLARFSDGLLAGVPLGDLIDTANAAASLGHAADLFGDRLYGLAELHRGAEDRLRLAKMLRLAKTVGVTPTASGAALYHDRSRRHLHDVLTAVRLKTPVPQLAAQLQANGERHLRTPAQIGRLYRDAPQLVARTLEVASRCRFCLSQLRYEYPRETVPDGLTPRAHLRRETLAGAKRRYPNGTPPKVREQIETELRLIDRRSYEPFFLTVYEAVRFARSRGILCQGRGSAANSAVCFCLGITEIDPARSSLLFERFLSMARDEAPDIDVDFEHERREEVIQHLYAKYGRHRCGIAAAVATYRPRSAVRDIGKALGLSADRVDALAKQLGRWTMDSPLDECLSDAGLDPGSRTATRIARLLDDIKGFPRHLSQHSGGMVLTEGRLDESVPIENAAMAGRTVIQWDKDDLAAAGLLKVDVLALGMLTAVRKCRDLINRHYRPVNRPLRDLAEIPGGDRATYRMICNADTVGVFQIESRAQMSMLPRLRPKRFYDLVIEVAIVRPGPIQGDMVHPYLRRRDGIEQVSYPSEEVKGVLGRTLGVPIFQEQAMELAKVAAGFSAEEADQFRRAIGAWRSTGLIDTFEKKLKAGLDAKGYSGEFADRLFKQIRGFGEYGFPESHAASFALLVYSSCWMKCHYPAAFCCALLNSQPMGFYQPAQLVSEVRGHGVDVRPVDVNFSDWDSTLEPCVRPDAEGRVGTQETGRQTQAGHHDSPDARSDPRSDPRSDADRCAIRLGLQMVRGLKDDDAARLVAARGDRPFVSYEDLCDRTGLPGEALRRLAEADAFGSLELNRRQASWAARPGGRRGPLLTAGAEAELVRPVALPPMSASGAVTADYRATGLSLQGHPLQFLRASLAARGVAPAKALARMASGRPVSVAGVVLLRQMPGSAKGVVFLTLEDETGSMNLIVWPDIWRENHRTARAAPALIAHGRLQRQRGVEHVIVDRLERLQASDAGSGDVTSADHPIDPNADSGSAPITNSDAPLSGPVKGDCAPRRPRRSELVDAVDVTRLPAIDPAEAVPPTIDLKSAARSRDFR